MSSKPDKEQTPNMIDVLLSRKKIDLKVDAALLIKNVQNRINNALEKGYQYTRVIDSSEKFLKNEDGLNPESNIETMPKGARFSSTTMSQTLPNSKQGKESWCSWIRTLTR